MAQKKTSSKNTRGTQKKASSKRKTNAQKVEKKPLFDDDYKQLFALIGVLFSLLMAVNVFVVAGGIWGYLRNFFFGVFGFTAFVMPFFIGFISIMSALGKDSRKFKIKVTESVVIAVLVVAFLHIIFLEDKTLSYGEQIEWAYNLFKNYDGEGIHYGVGVLGSIFGGIPLLMTGANKLAAGIVTILFILAFLMFFTGTSILKIIEALKKPAEAVGEYAEEKIEDIKQTYESSAEEREDRKKRREAKKSERKKQQEIIDIDVPEDDYDDHYEEIIEEPIDYPADYQTEPVELEDVISLFSEGLGIDSQKEPERITTLEEMKRRQGMGPSQSEEILYTIEDDTLVVDSDTGEVIDDVEISDEPIADEQTEDETTESVSQAEPEIEYELPSVELLDLPKHNNRAGNANELREKGETIVRTLKSFGVGTNIVEICQSPSVTRYELQPEPGVKISRITALADDIAMNLAASGVRIEAPIPNKNAVGIEVPNADKAMVTLREILETSAFTNAKSKINVALGRNIQGESTCADLSKMPHLLVAGTTGSGKSVCLNTMIMSLLYNAKPDEVKLIMIDPKKVEFTVYKKIPHLLIPVVSDPKKAAGALSWAVTEMDKRYALFADNGVRNLQGYNTYALSNNLEKMPQIVIIIDELSDLMMAASNEVEDCICRLAQKARAAGMHLIVATQRPSVDVITGLIKANIPSRIAFAVKSQIDSRTIIDTQGAEKLLGNGDMLYCPVGLSKPVRVQGCYVSDDEIERVIEFVTSQGSVKYDDSVIQEIEIKAAQSGGKKKGGADVEIATPTDSIYDDEMTFDAIGVVVEAGSASVTLLQRKLKLGYARAARIVDELSEKGIIGPYEGAKPRKVLVTKEQWYEMQAGSSASSPKQLSIDDLPGTVSSSNTTSDDVLGDSSTIEHNYFGSAVETDFDED